MAEWEYGADTGKRPAQSVFPTVLSHDFVVGKHNYYYQRPIKPESHNTLNNTLFYLNTGNTLAKS